MSDNNAHPGVRNLLAKFETNSPSSVTSPPSRGRSPVGSDTLSARQLSKVRASFVTVDGAIQSSQGSPLRKTSGRSESPGSLFGPKINAGSPDSARQTVVSPTPNGGLDHAQKMPVGLSGDPQLNDTSDLTPDLNRAAREEPADNTSGSKGTSVLDKKEEPVPKTNTSTQPQNPSTTSETLKKRPSNINTSKAAAAKPGSHHKPSTGTKPTSAREPAKERTNASAPKPSRTSLNPATKPAARTAIVSTTAHDSAKSPLASGIGFVKPRPKSPTRPVRLPASMMAATQASAAKLGSEEASTGRPSTTEKPLARKPSTLKSATGAPPRAKTPTAASVRKQASRPSLAAQSANERPSSRISDVSSTRPSNDGFLARMMRPTASSASKTYDKPDSKAPAKPSLAAKGPRPSVGRVSERAPSQAKPKTAALRHQNEKSLPAKKEVASVKLDDKSVQPNHGEKENVEEPVEAPKHTAVETEDTIPEEELVAAVPEAAVNDTADAPSEPSVAEAAVESAPEPAVNDATEVPSEAPVETATEMPVEVPSEAPVEAPAEPSAPEPVQEPAEASAEDLIEVPAETSAEVPTEEPVQEPSETPAETAAEEPVSLATETPVEAPSETPAPAPAIPEEKDAEKPSVEAIVEVDAPEEPTTLQFAEPVVEAEAAPATEVDTPVPEEQRASQNEPEVSEPIEQADASEDAAPVSETDDTVKEPAPETPEVQPAEDFEPAAQPSTDA